MRGTVHSGGCTGVRSVYAPRNFAVFGRLVGCNGTGVIGRPSLGCLRYGNRVAYHDLPVDFDFGNGHHAFIRSVMFAVARRNGVSTVSFKLGGPTISSVVGRAS